MSDRERPVRKRDFVGIYKPNKNMNGSVAQFKLGNNRDCMFLEMAKQVRPMDDPKPYDWENTRITIKLGEVDIGKLLALFNGALPPNQDPNKEDLALFHENAKGHKVIKIKRQDRGYYMKVSVKEDGKQDQIAIPISWDEAELVRIALTRGYELMLGWQLYQQFWCIIQVYESGLFTPILSTWRSVNEY